ncbi:hypothetical protein [Kitasatospora purpeofusca]|uniref:hypothetical protein n=1 Tax=Kitasatospora purpeofusca TaxID=67352 RepID=UPI000B1858C4|nr:hypothetical protein [Kitasatospora purpeofusca]
MNRIVAVHGIGNYRPHQTPEDAAESLRTTWTRSLREPADLHTAYYAHLLRPTGVQSAGNSQLGGADIDGLTGPQAAMLSDWLNAYGVPEQIAQGRLTRAMRQELSWVAERSGKPFNGLLRFMARFVREVAWYLEHPERRTAARDHVAATIARVQPRVIVAHSLGSVVTYEALWSSAASSVPIELLVTVGSPLALPGAVLDRLDPAPVAGRGRRPPAVGRWINIADVGDLVAVPRLLTRAFDGIEEDIETSIAPVDFHTLGNYLACEAMEKALLSVAR